jgi:hypothetical protein
MLDDEDHPSFAALPERERFRLLYASGIAGLFKSVPLSPEVQDMLLRMRKGWAAKHGQRGAERRSRWMMPSELRSKGRPSDDVRTRRIRLVLVPAFMELAIMAQVFKLDRGRTSIARAVAKVAEEAAAELGNKQYFSLVPGGTGLAKRILDLTKDIGPPARGGISMKTRRR